YELVAREACCGMPLLEQGNLDGVAAKQAVNIPVLERYARTAASSGNISGSSLLYISTQLGIAPISA
ncbi:hypothetical protein QM306_36860, partial [Burkholderia cenocepacia]|nr:hypothetical protein [Burkholderia cenocepacia]